MMTPDLSGRWQTRLVLFALVLPTLVLLHLLFGYGTGLGAVLLLGLYWLVLGLALDAAVHGAQRLRREGDWPLAFTLYALALELLAVFGLMDQDMLPLLDDCALEVPDLALRRVVCRVATFDPLGTVAVYFVVAAEAVLLLAVILPVLAPNWRFRRWRLLPSRGRRSR